MLESTSAVQANFLYLCCGRTDITNRVWLFVGESNGCNGSEWYYRDNRSYRNDGYSGNNRTFWKYRDNRSNGSGG